MGILFGCLAVVLLVLSILAVIKPDRFLFWGKKTKIDAWPYMAACAAFAFISVLSFQNPTAQAPALGTSAVSSAESLAAVPSASPVFSSGPSAVSSESKSVSLPASSKPGSGSAQAENYPEGMEEGVYKIGGDLDAGEYVLVSDKFSYFQVAADSSQKSVLAYDNFQGRSIITVQDGQYLTVNSAQVYAIDKAPAVDLSSGILPQGMYKVGNDFKAGEYTIHATAGNGYYEIAKDSTHESNSVLSKGSFTGDKTITVTDGQYLKLTGAELDMNR